ncbi:MAG: hypothetical protein R2746_02695 [Acidimicrobiales bacterium]
MRRRPRRSRPLLLACVAVVAIATGPTTTTAAEPPATVSAEGDLMDFGPMRGPIARLTVRVLEQPDRTTTTDADGHWRIEGLPVGSKATFAIDSGERFPIQTATFTIGTEDLERVAFQSPTQEMVDLLSDLVGQPTRPDRCQIASTVTRRGSRSTAGRPTAPTGSPAPPSPSIRRPLPAPARSTSTA